MKKKKINKIKEENNNLLFENGKFNGVEKYFYD